MGIYYEGISTQARTALLAAGRDDGGAAVEPFTDREGGWPLRCCLADSRVGDRIAIVAYSPFAWVSPYREVGPVVVHAQACPGSDGSFPLQFEARDQVLKAFGNDDGRVHTQVYDLNQLVQAGDGLAQAILETLGDRRVEQVHVHNVLSQCFNFSARLT